MSRMPAREPRPLTGLVLVKTPDSWWRVAMDDPIGYPYLSTKARNVVRFATYIRRVVDVRDLDLERFAGDRGVGKSIAAEITLLRDVLRYRCRVPSPDRAAFEADLPRNRVPPAWQTVLEDDRLDTLGLGKRAGAALAAAGAVTAGDLLDLTLVEVLAVNGAGPATVVELRDFFGTLHHRFSDVLRPRQESLDGYFEDVCPRPPAPGRVGHAHAVLQRYLGLYPGDPPFPPWPSPAAIAADLGLPKARAGQIVSKANGTWRHPSRRRIRSTLNRVLEDRDGVASAAEIAGDLLARLGSAASPEVRRLRAAAIVRAGVEGEVARGPEAARFRVDRRHGEVFVVLTA